MKAIWLTSVALLLVAPIAMSTPEGDADRSSSLRWLRWVRWQPQGQWILFVRQGSDGNEMRIYKIPSDGTNLTALSPAGSKDSSPVWSPDGRQIAFISSTRGTANVYRMNADGTSVIPLGRHPGVLELVRWLPDGRIVFVAHRGDGGPLVGTMDATTGAEERFWCSASQADWHPSGVYVAISTPLRLNGALNWYVFEVQLNTKQRRQITFGEHVTDSAPRYSPDGEWIVFHSPSRSPTDSSLWLVRRDGTGMYCLPLRDGWDTEESDADFSPDGQYLAFARGEYEATDLYICRIDGTGLRRLTHFYPDGQAKGQDTFKVVKAAAVTKGRSRALSAAKSARPVQPAKPAKRQQKRAEGALFPWLAPPIPLRRTGVG